MVALFATLAVAIGLATPALAATITVNQPEEGHNFVAYQILDGTVTEDTGHTNVRLSNVEWGSNVNGDALLTALRSSTTPVYAATSSNGTKSNTTVGAVFADAKSAADFAAVFDWASDNSALANEVAKIINARPDVLKGDGVTAQRNDTSRTYTLTIDDPGYYFIRDGEGEDANVFVQIFNDDKEVAPKSATPGLEKKVQENTSYQQNGGYGTGYNDTADYSIGDMVPFKLIGTIPDTSAYSNGYQYTISDTLSTSLDLPSTSDVKVYLTTGKDSDLSSASTTYSTGMAALDVTSSFLVTPATSTAGVKTLTIRPNIGGNNDAAGANDLTKVPNVDKFKYVVVTYSAKLNSSAVLGQQAIAGNLGESGSRGNVNKARLYYSNNPSFPDADHQGETPEDYVIVFTYGTDVTKVSASDTSTKLQNVTFKLVKGTYSAAEGATNNYAQVEDGKLTGWTTSANAANTTLTTDANGNIKVDGLDAGTYNLVEINNPNSGYNTPSEPWVITITANTSNGQGGEGAVTELVSLSGTVTNGSFTNNVAFHNQDKGLVAGTVSGVPTTGVVSATITNTQGFQLPQTGGTGTIALTIVGVILAAGAIIGLSIRKRANDEQ